MMPRRRLLLTMLFAPFFQPLAAQAAESPKPAARPRDQGSHGHTALVPQGAQALGRRQWAIAEGYIPSYSRGSEPEFTSHETACLLNLTDRGAEVSITLFFSDRDPVGPYRVTVPARRTRHVRFNDLSDPAPVPRGTDYASVIESTVPIVVQHTRLDSRQAENALISTIAFPGHE